uniref:Peptidase M12A domain-containing protein n=1 Tax=Anopheles maculatus TaxID=74869 RepID=A0A182SJZ3_9DIPT
MSVREQTKPMNGAQMGQREGFSWSDMEKLNRMYNCQGSGANGQTVLRPPTFGMLPSVSSPAAPSGQGVGPYYPPSGPYNPYYPPSGGPVYPFGPFPGAGYPGPGFGYYPYMEETDSTEKQKPQ